MNTDIIILPNILTDKIEPEYHFPSGINHKIVFEGAENFIRATYHTSMIDHFRVNSSAGSHNVGRNFGSIIYIDPSCTDRICRALENGEME